MRQLGMWLCGVSAVVVAVALGLLTAGDLVVASAKSESPPAGPKGVIWTKLVKATANGNSLQKAGGCDGCADASAVSEQQIATGGGYMEITASETNTVRAIGLSSGPGATSPAEMKFSFLFQPGAVVEIRESGQYRTDTPFVPGDILKIAVQSGVGPGVVRYYKNGKLIYRSTVTPEFPLVVTASLLSLYSTFNNVVLSRTP